MITLRRPKIDGANDKEQLLQIKQYIFQLVEDLQFALNSSHATEDTVGHQERSGWTYNKHKNGIYEMFGTFNVTPKGCSLHNLLYQSDYISIATPFKIKSAFVSASAVGCYWITDAGILNNENIVLRILSDKEFITSSSIEVRLHVEGIYV